jgi:hypothetical protein
MPLHQTAFAYFFGALQTRNGRTRYIEEASSDLSPYFTGGAFDMSQVFEVNFIDPYQKLDEQSRQRVKAYYEARVEAVEPSLKKEFEKVFRI